MEKKKLTRAQEIKRKKKRKKKGKIAVIIGIIVALIIAAVLVFIFVIKDKTTQPTVNVNGEEVAVETQEIGELEGTWRNGSNTFTFDSSGNGSFTIDDESISFVYIANEGTLYINFVDENYSDCEYTYTVSGDTLSMNAGSGTSGGTYDFTRE